MGFQLRALVKERPRHGQQHGIASGGVSERTVPAWAAAWGCNFGPTLSHLTRCLHKSRVWCRITLRDKLYEPLVRIEFVSDSARSAAETPNFAPKYATNPLEIPIFAHMTNLGPAHTFSNEFSGAPRVFQNLYMAQDSHHTQPQPKRIDETRLTPK